MKKKQMPLPLAGEVLFITPRGEKSCFNGTMGALSRRFAL
jgi:hypothetical protein